MRHNGCKNTTGAMARKPYTSSSDTTQLDFLHWERTLKAERQVCKLVLTLVPKEGRNAVPTCHSDTTDCTICPLVVQARVGTRAGLDCGRAAGTRQAHGDSGVTGEGIKSGGPVSAVSSRPESGAVVECGGGPRPAPPRGGHVRPHRPRGHRQRRDAGATPGSQAQGQRERARSRALLALARGEGQRVALALRDGAG